MEQEPQSDPPHIGRAIRRAGLLGGVGISNSEIKMGKGENRHGRSQNPKSKNHKVIQQNR